MAAAYLVRASGEDRAFSHPEPLALNAMEAAILFAERRMAVGEVAVTVTDNETGREQCFRIDLEEHTAEPC